MTPKNSLHDSEFELPSGRSWLVVSGIAVLYEGRMAQQRNWLKYLNLSLMFIVLCCTGLMCLAQSDRGSVSGTVTDPSGATITGAKVTVTNAAMGTQNSTVTTGVGEYTVPELPAGIYSVTVVVRGFSTLVRNGITVSV